MSVTPKIHLTAFEDRTGDFIFVAIPDARGRYLRTDKSVALVPCPMCRAIAGEPCKSGSGDKYGGTTHAVRRNQAQHLYRGAKVNDLLDPIENPEFPSISQEFQEGAWPELPSA